MCEWLLRPKTKPCTGCSDTDPHDSHLTIGYRTRLRIYDLIFKSKNY
jgi:hypothetical protein